MLLTKQMLIVAMAMAFSSLGYAAQAATPDEAKAFAERAAAHFREVGPEKAIADFSDVHGGFVDVDADLFVVIYDPEGRIRCAPIAALLGRDVTLLRDVDGKDFGTETFNLARNEGSGWSTYRMTNPQTKKIGLKRSFVIGIANYTILVGAYAN